MDRPRRPTLQQEEVEAEEVRFGCPMLYRSRWVPAPGAKVPAHRCHLGWAIHTEDEVTRCLEADSVEDCWRLHPAHPNGEAG